MKKINTLIAFFVASLLLCSALGATPVIKIKNVPSYGVDGVLSGVVTGIDFATHRVAVYIQIEGLGWWTKPTFATPSVPINPDGTFTADVATGGIDNRATVFCAALIQDDVDPPRANGVPRIPAGLESLAMDCVERYGRTLEFAGLTWAVKEAPVPVGPGRNRFSDRPEDVFVDNSGQLHLTISYHDGFWWATEVILLDNVGFGTYSFQTASELDKLDVNATFGAFTWDAYGDEESVPNSPHREIDFEDSRWGDPSDITNAQMVVQPFNVSGNLRRYILPDLSGNPNLTRFFTWEPDQIEFVALRGHWSPCDFPAAEVIDEYRYNEDPALNHFVPAEGRQRFRFNLWLNNVELGGQPPPQPANGQRVEVIITDFNFMPIFSSHAGFYAPNMGTFFLKNSHGGGAADEAFRFGPVGSGWEPVTGDWDGDGVDTVGLYDASTGRFFLKNSHGGGAADEAFRFGPVGSGWEPVTGDWDGDGVNTVGFYDASTGKFFLKNSHGGGAADEVFRFGPVGSGWKPVTGDWDGDGVNTVGLYDASTGKFFLKNSHGGGAADEVFRFGPVGSGWEPVTGDWDGDGVDTVGLYDASTGKFFLKNSHGGGVADEAFRFGPAGSGWKPIIGDWDGAVQCSFPS